MGKQNKQRSVDRMLSSYRSIEATYNDGSIMSYDLEPCRDAIRQFVGNAEKYFTKDPDSEAMRMLDIEEMANSVQEELKRLGQPLLWEANSNYREWFKRLA